MVVDSDLAKRFRDYVDALGAGKRIVGIYLFGVEYGDRLADLSSSQCKALAAKAGFKDSLGTELHKAIRLAPYLVRKT